MKPDNDKLPFRESFLLVSSLGLVAISLFFLIHAVF